MAWMRRCRAALGGLALAWREHYHVEVRPRVSPGVSPPQGGRPGWKSLVGPRLGFWADPFVVERADEAWVFFEAFDPLADRGHIEAVRLDGEGAARVVLERPCHLSYPCVFERGGALYMLPETSRGRTLELYRCEAFPDRWTLARTLMAGIDAADTNVLYRQDRWWLVTSIRPEGEPERHLAIFHAEDLFAPAWTAHPVNARRLWAGGPHGTGRNAGPFFDWEGRLVRPVQQNPDCYGQGLAFFEVRRLTVDAYEEEPLAGAGPPILAGCERGHHVSFGERWCAMDVRDRR